MTHPGAAAILSSVVFVALVAFPAGSPIDFNGNGVSDFAVFRPAGGTSRDGLSICNAPAGDRTSI
jgi:hypothetical protein